MKTILNLLTTVVLLTAAGGGAYAHDVSAVPLDPVRITMGANQKALFVIRLSEVDPDNFDGLVLREPATVRLAIRDLVGEPLVCDDSAGCTPNLDISFNGSETLVVAVRASASGDGRPKHIEVLSYSWGASNPAIFTPVGSLADLPEELDFVSFSVQLTKPGNGNPVDVDIDAKLINEDGGVTPVAIAINTYQTYGPRARLQ